MLWKREIDAKLKPFEDELREELRQIRAETEVPYDDPADVKMFEDEEERHLQRRIDRKRAELEAENRKPMETLEEKRTRSIPARLRPRTGSR